MGEMTKDVFDMFAQQIASAEVVDGGNYIRDGKGRMIVKKIEFEQKNGGPTFIAEHVVETSQKLNVVALKFPSPGAKLDIEPNEPGTTASLVVKLTGDQNVIKSKQGVIKSYLCALLGVDPKKVTPAEFMEALRSARSPEQPAKGMAIDYETVRKLNKAETEEFVRPRWAHVAKTSGNAPEQIAERRAKLEG